MQVEFKAAPTLTQPTGTTAEAAQSARERAIARLVQGNQPASQPQATPEQQSAALTAPVETRQENTVEATQPEPKAPEEPISSQYAVLARQTKALRAKQVELQKREAALAAKEAPQAPQQPSFDESKYISKDRLLQDTFGTLAELGLSYDTLATQATNAPTPEQIEWKNTVKALKDEIAALKGDQESVKKSFEQRDQDSYKQALNQIRSEASAVIKNNPEFETIRETGSTDDVVELIEKTFAQDGTLLTVEDAAQQVEDYLVEEAMKIARIKKIQQRLASIAPTAPAMTQKQTGTPQQQQLKTLTNTMASPGKLTARQRAELAFKGELKKA